MQLTSCGLFCLFPLFALVSGRVGEEAASPTLPAHGLLGQSPYCCLDRQQAGVQPGGSSPRSLTRLSICGHHTWKAATNDPSSCFSVSVSVVFAFFICGQ